MARTCTRQGGAREPPTRSGRGPQAATVGARRVPGGGSHLALALQLHERLPRLQPHGGVRTVVEGVRCAAKRPVQQVEVQVGEAKPPQRREQRVSRLLRATHTDGAREGAARGRVHASEAAIMRRQFSEQLGGRFARAPAAGLAAHEDGVAVEAAAAQSTTDDLLVFVELAHVEQPVPRPQRRRDHCLVVIGAARA